MVRSRSASRAMGVVGLMWAGLARADALPPPPPCPPGELRETNTHAGPYCLTTPCVDDSHCGAGKICEPVQMCSGTYRPMACTRSEDCPDLSECGTEFFCEEGERRDAAADSAAGGSGGGSADPAAGGAPDPAAGGSGGREPTAGGAGGETATGGSAQAAGSGATMPTGGGSTSGGSGGETGAAGRATPGGQAEPETQGVESTSGGCGCSVEQKSAGAPLLVALLLLSLRRTRRRQYLAP